MLQLRSARRSVLVRERRMQKAIDTAFLIGIIRISRSRKIKNSACVT